MIESWTNGRKPAYNHTETNDPCPPATQDYTPAKIDWQIISAIILCRAYQRLNSRWRNALTPDRNTINKVRRNRSASRFLRRSSEMASKQKTSLNAQVIIFCNH